MKLSTNKGFIQHVKISAGFTLIELLLYIAIGALILIATSALLMVLIESREKDQIAGEVEGQGLAALALITQSIRNATAINSPASGVSASSLSLSVPGSASPTVFDLNNGTLRISAGGAQPAAITDAGQRVVVSNLTFSNLSLAGTPGIVRINATLNGSSASSWYSYNYSRNFTGTASLRPNVYAQSSYYAQAGYYSEGSYANYADLIPTPSSPLTIPAPTAGTPVSITAYFTNQGPAGTLTTFPDLYEIYPGATPPSTFAQLTSGGAVVAVTSPALGAGASNSVQLSYTFPTGGTWQIRGCANTDTSGNTPPTSGGAVESTYANNCGGWLAVSVANAPPPQTPPSAVDDFYTVAGSPWQAIFDPRANDSDPDGDALTIIAVSTPAHGTAVINSGTSITYTRTASFLGAEVFTYTISDGHGYTATATIDITIEKAGGGGPVCNPICP